MAGGLAARTGEVASCWKAVIDEGVRVDLVGALLIGRILDEILLGTTLDMMLMGVTPESCTVSKIGTLTALDELTVGRLEVVGDSGVSSEW